MVHALSSSVLWLWLARVFSLFFFFLLAKRDFHMFVLRCRCSPHL